MPLLFLLIAVLFQGCSGWEGELDELYGEKKVRRRLYKPGTKGAQIFQSIAKPILDRRCVSCHSCYDASCQLKLTSAAGIDRGSHKDRFYDPRLAKASPMRLHLDRQTTPEWREMDFFPVLNERNHQGNLEAGLLYQMLTLKARNPGHTDLAKPLPKEHYDFRLNREQQCPSIEEFPEYAEEYPMGGMPYGLPALKDKEYAALTSWLQKGAPLAMEGPLTEPYKQRIAKWEIFLNGASLKTQLAARYIYEHLFLAHLYFDDIQVGTKNQTKYFKLVRSRTPPGKPVSLISTRMPYGDPGVPRVYYRLIRDPSTIVTKFHLPYVLNPKRLAWMNKLFFEAPYEVKALPAYSDETTSSPFKEFEAIPVRSRYRFMLEEARFIVMGFIKGPVCRGQTALNVIQDHMWIFFVDPEMQTLPMVDTFLMQQAVNLEIPSKDDGYFETLSGWLSYADKNMDYLTAKMTAMGDLFPTQDSLKLAHIWDGDGDNKNAALTVFRHFNSSSVVHGLVGKAPKTSWLINYPLLERIHYLLVAGFDVFGNIPHQLTTRLYMDFLRQEGEQNYLTLFPLKERKEYLNFWYRDAPDAVMQHIAQTQSMMSRMIPTIEFRTKNPQLELYDILKNRLSKVRERKYDLDSPKISPSHHALLKHIEGLEGHEIRQFPEMALLTIASADGSEETYTILSNRERSHINSVFSEKETRLPAEDYLTVARGIIGDYPNEFWRVKEHDIPKFTKAISRLANGLDYKNFLTQFGVRRSHPHFWQHSDKVIDSYVRREPIEGGILDYNRLNNR